MPQWQFRPGMPGADRPPFAVGSPAALAACLQRLALTQFLDPRKLETLQSRQLQSLVTHHATQSPHFAGRLKSTNLRPEHLVSIAALSALPPLSRRDVQTAGDSFGARAVPQSHGPVGEVKTSGSTGEPVSIVKTSMNQLFWAALTIRDHQWHRRNPESRLTSIRANISNYLEHPTWGPPVDSLFECGPAQAIPITTGIDEQLRLVRRFAPEVLIIYPGNLAAFVAEWDRTGFDLHSIRHFRTIGETVSASLRTRVRQHTGCLIEDNYSSQEVGPIALECPESRLYHVMSESVLVEVLRADGSRCVEGETGRIVVTDLHNLASPMVRYDIGDYAEVGGTCKCGRGLPTLARIRGRERNLVRKPDGSRHWPLVGFHRFGEVAPVRQYQFIQHSLEELEFKVVTDAPLSPSQETALAAIAREALGHGFQVRIVQSRERLAAGANGKFEEFVCRMP